MAYLHNSPSIREVCYNRTQHHKRQNYWKACALFGIYQKNKRKFYKNNKDKYKQKENFEAENTL